MLQYSITSVEIQIAGRGTRQIADSIESAIREGILAPGQALPSVRRLAARASVSPTTAATALAELRRRGLIVTRERRRSYVSPRPPLGPRPVSAVVPAGVRDLASGHPDSALLPDLGVVMARVELRQRLYDEEPVLPELARLARAEFGEAGIAADHLCLASGALDGVERVLDAHLVPGDRIAVEDPCYSAHLDLVRAMGLIPEPVAVDELGPVPERLAAVLASGVKALVLTPRAQNPTGAALDGVRATELANVISRHPPLLVVEDDHQGPLAGSEGLSVVGEQRRWARVRSVTKALGPDLRMAFVSGDELTVSRVEGRLALGPGWISEILQRLVVELMRQESVQKGLQRATHTYAQRREALLATLADHGIPASGRSGFNVWVPVPDESAVVASLLARGWFVAPGAPYRLESEPAVRVTTTTLDAGEAEQLAADFAAVLTGRRRRIA